MVTVSPEKNLGCAYFLEKTVRRKFFSVFFSVAVVYDKTNMSSFLSYFNVAKISGRKKVLKLRFYDKKIPFSKNDIYFLVTSKYARLVL